MKLQFFRSYMFAAVFAVIGMFAAAGSANAQTRLTFTTQFDFVLGRTMFEAGKYEIARTARGFFILRSETAEQYSIIATTMPTAKSSNTEQVVFHRYGDRYFLRGVYMSRGGTGVAFAETSAERNLRRTTLRLANNEAKPEIVSASLNNE